MSLFDVLTEKLSDPTFVAVIMESEMEPTQGWGSMVCPPTYASAQNDRDKRPRYAQTPDARIPAPSDGGWHHAYMQQNGEAVLGHRVVLNSLGACADNAETPLWLLQNRLGVRLPGFIVSGMNIDEGRVEEAIARIEKASKKGSPSATARRQAREAVRVLISSWELAHRTADSWLMYAKGKNGAQIWAEDAEPGSDKHTLLSISHRRGDLVYAYAPNVAIFGVWLSAGTALRQAIPRSYTCEITGYGSRPVFRATTKLDPTGGATGEGLRVSQVGDGIEVATKGLEPSKQGFGQIPNQPEVAGFECDVILRQASISAKAFDLFVYPDDADGRQALAAKRVYVLLAMAGHLFAGESGFLRSGCDLVTVAERWGWRRHGVRHPEPLAVPAVQDVADALKRAVDAAQEVGLSFADVVEVELSDAELDLIVDRVLVESSKGGVAEASGS